MLNDFFFRLTIGENLPSQCLQAAIPSLERDPKFPRLLSLLEQRKVSQDCMYSSQTPGGG